jgi:hypothetical protein
VLKACPNLVGGPIRSGDNLDRLEWTAQASEAQSEATICRRFVGGSARNRAVFRQSGATGARYAIHAEPHKHWRLHISLIWRVGT